MRESKMHLQKRANTTDLELYSSLQHSVQIFPEIQSRTFEHCAKVCLPEKLPLQKILLPLHSLHGIDLEEGHIHVLRVLETKNMLGQTAFVFPFELDVTLVLSPTKLQVFGRPCVIFIMNFT